ncbi:hypothetical protein REMIM1_PD00451 (plasmid) [Rhizobium etli bv. mimosae str. Mim1]|nr:hypothetical protein REMIM1_PD00451 [Rhizobium etli bv. mimosae str. Mim1]
MAQNTFGKLQFPVQLHDLVRAQKSYCKTITFPDGTEGSKTIGLIVAELDNLETI